MLMFDRITEINKETGDFKKGFIKAELDIKDNLWFFDCHFQKDPVMPGCLGLDAMWQLVGFYLCWLKLPGYGRALGVDKVKFFGQVTPKAKLVEYKIDMKRVVNRGAVVGFGDGDMFVDGKHVYSAKGLRVGFWQDFYRNGAIKMEGNFISGERNGELKEYHENGQLKLNGWLYFYCFSML